MTSRASITKLLVVAGLCTLSFSDADAKDLRPIAEFLRPAYSAMNLSLLCAQDDPEFLHASSGPRGNPVNYAEHIKDETISSLSADDVIAVLKLAADDARNDARSEFRKIVPTQTYQYPQIAGWCRGYVLEFVRGVIKAHDENHTVFMVRLNEEKQRLYSSKR